ncbi:MAG: hypothetical protein AAFQ87_27730, partial [Bacteroidota bacterium]
MVSFTAEDGTVWVGNNEDYFDPHTYIWTEPAKRGKYGSVFFGFGNFFAQGGINEAGLVFDGFAMENKDVNNLEGKKNTNPADLIKEIMANCATIAEVKEICDRYKLDFLNQAQLMFVDSKGNSLIVEGDDYLEKGPGEVQFCTNFYQSDISNFSEITCPRYLAGHTRYTQNEDAAQGKKLCTEVISAMYSKEWWGGTQYTNVYDTRNKKIHLYLFHNFEEEVVLSVEDLLSEEREAVRIESMFTDKEAYETFRDEYDLAVAQSEALTESNDIAVLRKAAQDLASVEQSRLFGNQILQAIEAFNTDEKYELSIAVITPLLLHFDQSWELRAMKAKAHYEREEYELAMAAMDEAIELDPENERLLEGKEKMLEEMEKE